MLKVERHLKVKEVAELSAGIFLQSAAYGTVACLQASDFGGDGLLVRAPEHIFALTARQERNLLAEGDVLLTTKGHHHPAYLFPAAATPAVAGTAFTVLRLRQGSGLLPAFLRWWLNTDETQALLGFQAVGSGIPSISKEAVGNLEVPIPALSHQTLILRLQALADEELRLRTSVAEKRFLFITRQLTTSIKQ